MFLVYRDLQGEVLEKAGPNSFVAEVGYMPKNEKKIEDPQHR